MYVLGVMERELPIKRIILIIGLSLVIGVVTCLIYLLLGTWIGMVIDPQPHGYFICEDEWHPTLSKFGATLLGLIYIGILTFLSWKFLSKTNFKRSWHRIELGIMIIPSIFMCGLVWLMLTI